MTTGFYEFLLVLLRPYDIQWVLMYFYRALCVFMVPYGFL